MPNLLGLLATAFFAACNLSGASTTASPSPDARPAASPMAESWYRRVDALPPDDRRVLMAVNRRHFGALAYQDAAEKARLEALGFPTVEDVLAASKLSNDALESRADGGDDQAQMLLVDRLILEAESALADRDADLRGFEVKAARAYVAMAQISHSRSPFRAYLDGRMQWKLSGSMGPEMMAASLMLASEMGDWRARTWLAQFQRQHQGMDAAKALGLFAILRRTWSVDQPPPRRRCTDQSSAGFLPDLSGPTSTRPFGSSFQSSACQAQ